MASSNVAWQRRRQCQEILGNLSVGSRYINGSPLIQGFFSSGPLESLMTLALPHDSSGDPELQFCRV
jgi:hypothetical protein